MSSSSTSRSPLARLAASASDLTEGRNPPGKMYRLMKSSRQRAADQARSSITMACSTASPSGASSLSQQRKNSSYIRQSTASIISTETSFEYRSEEDTSEL